MCFPSSSETDLSSGASEEVTRSTSTTFSQIVGSFLMRKKKKELTIWLVFTRNVPSAGRRAHSQDIPSRKSQRPSQTCRRFLVSSTLISSLLAQKSSITPKAKANVSEPKPLTSTFTRYRWYALTLFQTFQPFHQGGRWACSVNSPQVQPELGSRLNFFFVARVMEVTSSIFCLFQAHSTLAFLFSPDFLLFTTWCKSFVLSIQRFPLWPFDSLENGLAECVPIRVNLRKLPSLVSHTRSVNEGTQHTFFQRSQGELTRVFPDDRSREFCCEPWSYHFLGHRFTVQISKLSLLRDCPPQ